MNETFVFVKYLHKMLICIYFTSFLFLFMDFVLPACIVLLYTECLIKSNNDLVSKLSYLEDLCTYGII